MTNFNSTFGNSVKDCISLAASLVEGFVQGAQRKKLIIAPFVKRFRSSYFVKVELNNLNSTFYSSLHTCFTVVVLLVEDFIQIALRKELVI